MMVNFTQLQYFKTVADAKNITRAADTLFITQSALSKAISRLEKSIGAPLFNRMATGVELNENGKLLYAFVDITFSDLDKIVKQIQNNEFNKQSHVSLCSAVPGLMTSIAENFLAGNSGIGLSVKKCTNQEVFRLLLSGEAQIGLTTEDSSDSRVRCRAFIEEEIVFLAHRDSNLALRESVDLAELEHEPVVLDKLSFDIADSVNLFSGWQGVLPGAFFQSNEASYFQTKVSDLGISIISQHMYVTMRSGGKIPNHIKLNILPKLSWTIYLADRPDAKPLTATKIVYDYIEAALIEYADEIS